MHGCSGEHGDTGPICALPQRQGVRDRGPARTGTAIQSTGFFRNKARNIQECCKQLVAKYRGQVPRTMDELLELPGIGRKTANVVLGNAYDVPGITVDTHVGRLSRRMGLTRETDANKVERDLMPIIPKKEW